MDTWIRSKTGGDPEQIVAGYSLEGTALRNYTDLAFVGPFGVAAIIGGDQDWVDAIWQMLESADEQGYYGDTLKVLAMITMSGNWWAPEAAPCGGS
jgi:hypothetical protein